MLENRPWVPTKTGVLVKPEDAVFTCGINEAGIFEVAFDEVAYPQVVVLLKRMGIEERSVLIIRYSSLQQLIGPPDLRRT
jgi:hypothetical protein